MARYSQYDFYQQPSRLDVNPAEEEEMSVLDEKILDTHSPLSDPRSYDTDTFSHRNSVWSNYSHSSDQSRPASHLGQSILDSTATYMPMDGPQTFAHPHWSLSRTASGSCTPTAYDQYQEPEGNSAQFAGGAVGPVGAIPMGAVYRSFAPAGGVAMSPQSSQGWVPAPMDLADVTAQAKASAYRNGSPLTMRRDGIRKKNARFDIPAERTLSNIDHLISQSNNDDEIKELKQQKRLLRNRQAALDSRQRKKLHTEKLEEEKKHFTHAITQLEEMVSSLRKRETELLHEKAEWMSQQQQITQYLEGLHMEKDEMIRVHTLETAELRKKNTILREAVEKLERGAKPSMPENHGEFSGFDHMSMEGHPWEEFSMTGGLPMPNQVPSAPAQHAQPLPQGKPNSEYPFSWNAFYMCLLFGAFIASNNTSLAGHYLPQMSEEYRAESSNVLKAVLASSPPGMAHSTHAMISASATGPGPTAMSGMDMAQMGPAPTESSALDQLHDTLVMPTEEQERAQVFAMNPDQYNSLTTFEDGGAGFKPQQPSNLQQALAAMRSSQNRMHEDSSGVHSRSLMWERVPEKVIRDFQRMVQEFGANPVKQEMVGFQHA
ncbi:hypothetical protein N7495_004711 [Penicillium taxi]|uniref:uncharacterized protein n=1 Tax=Penicillium taxi TaxID=168475 RepID=UPI0025454111|nr:uncharacterized protein N7495_004711 [Penicillium taxi]KAJ5899967.1 hypothetical protein N7495_004711 [Penicillium taxi]